MTGTSQADRWISITHELCTNVGYDVETYTTFRRAAASFYWERRHPAGRSGKNIRLSGVDASAGRMPAIPVAGRDAGALRSQRCRNRIGLNASAGKV